MAAETLRDLYEDELRDLYAAEQHIISALPELSAAASDPDLRAALDKHLQRTRIHVERLDLLFKQHGMAPGARQSSGIEGVVRTGSARVRPAGDRDVRDAAIIAAAQHVEHYEMAGYGCARTFARQLGDEYAADLLQQTLDEEGAADKELTRIAQSGINQAASAGASDDDTRLPWRLRHVDADDLPAAADFRGMKIRNMSGDEVGSVDGFIVDSMGRPYYLVVDSGGLFVGRRYVVPIGKTDLVRGERLIRIDLDKETLKRYPEFHRDAFMAMTDAEARRYEWRVLEAIDPEAARSTKQEWDYNRFPYYRQPDWFDNSAAASSRAARSDASGTVRHREASISTEREARERVLAREDVSTGEGTPHERIRGRSKDDIR
jgi:ferritin-like metal-binding protein YciE